MNEFEGLIPKYEAVDNCRLSDMEAVCYWSRIGCLLCSVIAIVVGLALPAVLPVSKALVWGCMALEAASIVFYRAAAWIKNNIL